MYLKVEYIYGPINDIKENIVMVNADIDEDTSYEEVNRILKPLIGKQTGHYEIKIMSYGEAI
ncbi:hypothetical protein ACIQYS_09845 [Psychrobacillus sp. NPDC096426]|uniref:hypothetical protein n=1 Tax=Psychrobacillus sp. NPDC096426 TaxID=3364491 RepID=UPI00381E5F34